MRAIQGLVNVCEKRHSDLLSNLWHNIKMPLFIWIDFFLLHKCYLHEHANVDSVRTAYILIAFFLWKSTVFEINFYSLLCGFFTSSRRTRRKIFPDGFFGISSTNRSPPWSCFGTEIRSKEIAIKGVRQEQKYISSHPFFLLSLPATYWIISFSVIFDFGWRTTNANAFSPHKSSGMPTTPVSLMCLWVNSSASISAGGTWKPLYFISSLMRSTI